MFFNSLAHSLINSQKLENRIRFRNLISHSQICGNQQTEKYQMESVNKLFFRVNNFSGLVSVLDPQTRQSSEENNFRFEWQWIGRKTLFKFNDHSFVIELCQLNLWDVNALVVDDRRFGGRKQLVETNVTCVSNYNSEGLSRRFKGNGTKGWHFKPSSHLRKVGVDWLLKVTH